jgi:hypothetical protein
MQGQILNGVKGKFRTQFSQKYSHKKCSITILTRNESIYKLMLEGQFFHTMTSKTETLKFFL